MKRKMLLFSIGVFLLMAACASSIKYGFNEPTSDETLIVVGRLIVHSGPERDLDEVTKDKISVALLGRTTNGKTLSIWIETDENGYFAVADVPKGTYAIKAIRTMLGIQYLNMVNELKYPTSLFRVMDDDFFPFTGDYYPFEAEGRVLSLKHNIITILPLNASVNPIIQDTHYLLKDFQLADGETLNAGPVEEYFMKKYPDSQWMDALKASSRINKIKR